MTNRALLRSQIQDAWQQTVETCYRRQRINSERSLQAALWSKLDLILPPDTRRMFIEPRMHVPGLTSAEGGATRFPDLVVCNTKEVIGIIELKYGPRVLPDWEKDLATFKWIAEQRGSITVCNSRYRGEEVDGRPYPLSDEVLFVWAGIHASSNSDLAEHVEPSLRSMFMELHEHT
jgi:hypothetical protein